MKFTLTFQGDLPPTGNKSKSPKKKSEVRRHISSQLDELWHVHPALQRLIANRLVPRTGGVLTDEEHHSNPTIDQRAPAGPGDLDLCASIAVTNPTHGTVNFRPLVRRSLALTCSLSILFMRKEEAGSVYMRGRGAYGDLDNRIKTVLDALTVPPIDQSVDGGLPFMYALLEDDALVTALNIQTRRLLNAPGTSASHVNLVIEVDVRLAESRHYNRFFLGD